MTIVQTILEAAYARSVVNDPGKLATDQELWEQGSRTFQRLYAVWAASNRDPAASQVILTMAGSPPNAALPADVIDVIRCEDASGGRVTVCRLDEKDRGWVIAPAVYRLGASLVSRGKTGDPGIGPVSGTVYVYVLDTPAAWTGLAVVLDTRFPARFHDLVILELAVYLSIKDDERDPKEYAKLKGEYREQLAAFAALNNVSLTAVESPHLSAVRGAADKG
jgi:hypothetical protein